MLNCNFCNKGLKNKGALIKHQNGCKLNPNRIFYKNNLADYNQKVNDGEIEKKITNQYIKAKLEGISIKMSDDTKKKLSEKAKTQIWADDRRKKHSIAMRNAVKNNPKSYSSENVCGRVKSIEAEDSFGNKTKLNGKWELLVSEWLTKQNIKWTNKIPIPFSYQWNNKWHLYFPDFYLPELELYIEVKGFERERDNCKWKSVKKLLIIKKKEIDLIVKNELQWPLA